MSEKKTLKSLLGTFISKKTQPARSATKLEAESVKKRRRLDPIASGPPGNGRPTRNLYIRNLHPNTTDRDLRVVFGLHCEVHSVVMMEGFCFVNTTSVEGASKALKALQGSRILGNEITINYAKDKFEGRPQPPLVSSAAPGTVAPPPGVSQTISHPQTREGLPGLNQPHQGSQRGHVGGQIPTSSLHVTGYDISMATQSSVARVFEQFGHVLSVAIKNDFCFVNFRTVESAVRAKTCMSGARERLLCSSSSNRLFIRFARDRPTNQRRDPAPPPHPRSRGCGAAAPSDDSLHSSSTLRVSGFSAETSVEAMAEALGVVVAKDDDDSQERSEAGPVVAVAVEIVGDGSCLVVFKSPEEAARSRDRIVANQGQSSLEVDFAPTMRDSAGRSAEDHPFSSSSSSSSSPLGSSRRLSPQNRSRDNSPEFVPIGQQSSGLTLDGSESPVFIPGVASAAAAAAQAAAFSGDEEDVAAAAGAQEEEGPTSGGIDFGEGGNG